MTAQLIDGKAIAVELRHGVSYSIRYHTAQGRRVQEGTHPTPEGDLADAVHCVVAIGQTSLGTPLDF